MSDTQTPASVPPSVPTFGTQHIFGSPGLTLVGLWPTISAVEQMISTSSVPTTSAGWLQLSISVAVTLLSAFARG